ncbi:helix-turn-helix domain-containing protein [Flammeovirga agarivorans]|uniref:Helix-turn-helix transcriptional regulator n=1 Tax=Flammeovirga agarivorans TaxID=2726742 RepID=A0A7X8SKX6_9BACT|nr:AraC family transcriptional regulator [Flammeovirga agarivorans]NLR92114.1 helix-turn-helix transcriptional regulator [Flammeovirga agarivorans]
MKQILSILTLIGSANGLFLSTYLRFHRKLSLQGKLLVYSTMIWSYVALMYSLMQINPFANYMILRSIGSSATTLLYPLLYLYLKYAYTGKDTFDKVDRIHFVIPFSFLILSVPIVYWDAYYRVTSIFIENELYADFINRAQDISNIVMGYMYLGAFLYQYKNAHSRNMLSDDDDKSTKGLFFILAYLYLGVHTFGVYGVISNVYGLPLSDMAFPIYYITFVIFLYVIFHWVISQRVYVLLPTTKKDAVEKRREVELQLNNDLEIIIDYIEDEKAYLKNDFSLITLAKEVKMHRSRVSFVINEGLNMNFNEFISHYRIKEAKKLLRSDEGTNLKLEFLAKESGFNSKSTFNRAFKEKTGLTPSQYRESNKKAL